MERCKNSPHKKQDGKGKKMIINKAQCYGVITLYGIFV